MPRRIAAASLIAAFAAAAAAVVPAAHAAAPTDPQAAGQQPLSIMRVPQALDAIARPLQDVPVLVADTGLDLDHPDIASRLYSLPAAVPAPNPDGLADPGMVQAGRAGWDLIGTTHHGALHPDDDPSDPEGGWSGHGTQVAGVLGAAWNNGQGGAGVAPNARFVALRTCWDGDECFQYVQAAAIDWAAARGAKVASFSWLSGPLEDSLRDAIRRHPEMLFVTIPSGNGGATDVDGDDPQPCGLDLPNVLCVSTSAPDDALDCGGFSAGKVDVAVPTQANVTTVNGGGFGPTGCATSFAAPAAAGVATILYGVDPSASAADVRGAIVDSARRVPAWQGKSVSGGIVDAAAAVTLFQQRRGIAAAGGGATPGGNGGRSPAPAPRPAPAPADRTKPVLSITHRANARRIFTSTLSEPATLSITIERQLIGRRSFGKCRPQNRSNSHKPRCVHWTAQLPAIKQRAAVGTRRVVIKLRPTQLRKLHAAGGTYRVSVTATDAAGNTSTVQRAGMVF